MIEPCQHPRRALLPEGEYTLDRLVGYVRYELHLCDCSTSELQDLAAEFRSFEFAPLKCILTELSARGKLTTP